MSTHIVDASPKTDDASDISLPVVNKRREAEDLADFVRRVRAEKGLSLKDVEDRSGGAISKGYVGHIENRHVLGSAVTAQKLFALAKGLGVTEDEVLAAVRSITFEESRSFDSEIFVMFKGFDELSDEDKAELLTSVRMLGAEIQRRRSHRKKGPNDKGRKKS